MTRVESARLGICEIIYELMTDNKVTSRKLAKRLGKSKKHIKKILRAERDVTIIEFMNMLVTIDENISLGHIHNIFRKLKISCYNIRNCSK